MKKNPDNYHSTNCNDTKCNRSNVSISEAKIFGIKIEDTIGINRKP